MAGKRAYERQYCTAVELEAIGLDLADWNNLKGKYKAYDELREQVIKKCRDVQKLAKQSVYSLQRNDTKRADGQIKEAEVLISQLLPLIAEHPTLRLGSFTNALEEYAESVILRVFLTEGRIAKSTELPLLTLDEYFGGLFDFTGELNRVCIARATLRDKQGVKTFHRAVEELFQRLVLLDFKSPNLRRKLPALCSTERKMQHTLYELSLTEGTRLAHVDDILDYEPAAVYEDAG